MRKILKLLGAFAVVAVISVFIYLFLISPDEKFQSVYLVPENAAFFIESESPLQAWGKIIHSDAWNFLKTNELLSDLNKNIESLDSAISKKRILLKVFGSRRILISAHQYKPGKYQFLFVIDLKKTSKLKRLKNYLDKLLGNELSVSQRMYYGYEIFELLNKKSGDTYYFSFIKNQLIFSPVHLLIEASIDQLDKLTLGRDLNFIDVSRHTSGKGLFSLCINYTYFKDYLAAQMGKSNEFVNSLAASLYYTSAYLTIDESGMIRLTGYSSIRDSSSSYIKALLASGRGSHEMIDLAPSRTASLINLGFNNARRFYENIGQSMDIQTRNNIETTIQKTEQKLDIDLQKTLLDWIDDEIAFVQTQPSNLGRQNEFALIIKAKSIKSAQESLAYLGKQIKKKSPVKFKEIQYKGYVINYLHIPGIFKLLFGKLLERLEKPYYAMIDKYVVFSNHPQTLKSIIDDYETGKTIEETAQINQFIDNFPSKSIVLGYFQTPVLFNNLKEFVSGQTWNRLIANKKYFECFPNIGINLEPDGDLLKFDIAAEFNPVYEEYSPVTYQFEPLGSYFEDTTIQLPVIEENPEKTESEIVIDDLDASKHEEFFDNGDLKLSVELKNGLKHGIYKEFYENGELKIRGHFKNDLMDGTWKYYDENGKVSETVEYKDGEKIR